MRQGLTSNPGCPVTHYVGLAGVELRVILLPLPSESQDSTQIFAIYLHNAELDTSVY